MTLRKSVPHEKLLKDFQTPLTPQYLSPEEEDVAENIATRGTILAGYILLALPDTEKRAKVLEMLQDTCVKAQLLIKGTS